MATCDLGYDHEDPAPEPAAEPVVIETDPGPNDNDVRIAEIEAAASVEREKIYAAENKDELALEVERLRGELAGIQETLATLAPPPPPEVIPVPAPPAPEPAPEPVAAPADVPEPKSGKKKGFWGPAYS